ncbi:hypothetical protein GCM10027347_11200 [Larkinella harenae]
MIWIYMLVSLGVLIAGFINARRLSPTQTVAFSVCIILLLIYSVLTPLYFYLTGRKTIVGDQGLFLFTGKDITPYYEKGMLFHMIANVFFVFGFLWKRYPDSATTYEIKETDTPELRRKVVGLYLFFFAIVFVDLLISGINPLAIITGVSEESIFLNENSTRSFYFRNCADCIVTTIIVFAFLKGKPWKLALLLIPAFVLFAVMGFRYRMIITLLGIVIGSIASSSSDFNARKWLVIGCSLLYFVFFITYNRWNFIAGRFSDLSYNPAEFDYEMFFDQTHQSLNDYNLIRYYEANPELGPDYGLTMFGYVFIKAIPKFFFKNGEKPYPPPALAIVNDSLEFPPEWPKTGETTMHYGGFYGAFGWFGAVFMPFLLGFVIHLFSSRNPSTQPVGLLNQIVLSLALFMFISRGYFPQFLDNFVYLSIPIWLTKKSIKQLSVVTSKA